MKKKIWKIIGLSLLALVVLIGAVAGGLMLYSANYSVDAPAQAIVNQTGLVQTSGRGLYDASGKLLRLQGINAGQILVQEGWMSPFATEPLKNADGSYVLVSDSDINTQYSGTKIEKSTDGFKFVKTVSASTNS